MFMLTKTHEAAIQQYLAYEALLDQLQSALGFFSREAMLATLKMARDMHDQKEAAVLFPAFAAERERFKLAAADLAKQAEEIAELKVRLHYAEPRAIKWDNSLKRSRDRKAAKNRGGGK